MRREVASLYTPTWCGVLRKLRRLLDVKLSRELYDVAHGRVALPSRIGRAYNANKQKAMPRCRESWELGRRVIHHQSWLNARADRPRFYGRSATL
jgi:hypothetical protein